MDAIEEVKQRLSIEDIIGEYVELKRAGRNFRGLSPFTHEKTPSFMVSPEKQIWHDFSSGKGGNIFSFVMEVEGLDFKGALELLARKGGIDLSQYRGSRYTSNSRLKERLWMALDLAAKFYQLQLKGNRDVLDYVLKERAINKETVLNFRIGYAPAGGQALTQFLLKKKFTADEIKKTGLGNSIGGAMRDMFRGRMMIPLTDAMGRVIGFTARIIEDNQKAPKYINTPQTILYDKSRHVFGLFQAKESIRKQNFAVVVEGNMDVIASHQAGVTNVVATAGTAMTPQHLKEISRFSNDIRLGFDFDQAGQRATERTINLAIGMDIKLGVIDIVGGKDPDELIKTDKKAWQQAIARPEYALDWLLDYYGRDIDLTSGAGKKVYADKAGQILSRLSSAVEKEHYQNKLASQLGVSKLAIERQTPASQAKTYKKPKSLNLINKSQADVSRTENQYLSLLFHQPSLRIYMDVVTPDMIKNKVAAKLFEVIKEHQKAKAKDLLDIIKDVQDLTDYGKVVSLLYEELYANLEFVDLQDEAARLQVRVIEYFVKEQQSKITVQLKASPTESAANKLLQEVKNLNQLLKKAKETMRGQ